MVQKWNTKRLNGLVFNTTANAVLKVTENGLCVEKETTWKNFTRRRNEETNNDNDSVTYDIWG